MTTKYCGECELIIEGEKCDCMTTATELLRMIESVDPSDAKMMDEIDAHVWRYTDRGWHEYGYPKYTRSRDALKAVRVDGIDCLQIENNSDRQVSKRGRCQICIGDKVFVGHAPTEELAELHAIIQAIDFERKEK